MGLIDFQGCFLPAQLDLGNLETKFVKVVTVDYSANGNQILKIHTAMYTASEESKGT